ncbi:SRPBCC family protein [Polluticoccus soli]|uniref:SRPBCC family protein n=1 Tax=Polluticoccus soli TaxID=3034150 RepID=UPI0023E0EDB2|nr:SRPBCC domain-containing protein [Flavipsychrobacter sp. JY13-12]
MIGPFSKTITINAPVDSVWKALTDKVLIQQWMSETPIEIVTDWTVGGSFIIRGKHYKVPFENKGTVLQYEAGVALEYSHLSSISRLKDEPGNYTSIAFKLEPSGSQTTLLFTASNFPTETIYKHLAFYWNVTLEKIKKQVEAAE